MSETQDKPIFLSPPHMSGHELALVKEAFASNYIAPAGAMLRRFEEGLCEVTGFSHAVALSSGTAALHLALRLAGVGRGDQVWCSSLTFIGNVAPVTYLGARPVFFDVSPDSWNLDPSLLAAELALAAKRKQLPAAILPTDLYGQSCDLDAILQLAGEYHIPVIVDSAEALGTRYKDRHAGKGAFAAALSFNGNKIITTSGGGALLSDDAAVIEKARFLSEQARDQAPHYQHSEIGYNYRLSNISAAIGLGQLKVLAHRVARRREIFFRYRELLAGLAGLSFMPVADYGTATHWLTVIEIDPQIAPCDRETVRKTLKRHNIESRPVWKPMHMQPVFSDHKMVGGAVCERVFANGLCLPSGTALTDSDISRIAAIIRGCFEP